MSVAYDTNLSQQLTNLKTGYITHHKCASSWASGIIRTMEKKGYDVYYNSNGDHPRVPKVLEYVLHVIRDPRDIIISAYHSHLMSHPINEWYELLSHREALKSCSYIEGLKKTIQFLECHEWIQSRTRLSNRAAPPLISMLNWDYDDPRIETVRSEDITQQPFEYFKHIYPEESHELLTETLDEITYDTMKKIRPEHYSNPLTTPRWNKEMPQEIIELCNRRYSRIISKYYTFEQ